MNNNNYECIATAAFGLEGIVAKELTYMGLNAKGELGGARFYANASEILYANINLRCSDRVLIILAEKEVKSFDELFELAYNIDWSNIMEKNTSIPVKAKCVKSQIMSLRDTQAIVKKAIVKRLQNEYRINILPENGSKCCVDVSIHNNIARISVDTSGEALNKRGYRILNGEAALRETLAAAMVTISPWKKKQALYDPCCGTGTLLIEAALMALKKPAGINRKFDIENWKILSNEDKISIREKSLSQHEANRTIEINGSDIDSNVIEMANKHVQLAGLTNRISIYNKNIKDIKLENEEGCFICNPPYGERMGEIKEAEWIYRELGNLLKRHPGWSMAVISNDINFENHFGKKANKKRKVFNGRIECNIYMYYN